MQGYVHSNTNLMQKIFTINIEKLQKTYMNILNVYRTMTSNANRYHHKVNSCVSKDKV